MFNRTDRYFIKLLTSKYKANIQYKQNICHYHAEKSYFPLQYVNRSFIYNLTNFLENFLYTSVNN